ncbi:gamma-glutamylcyclotransferase [Acidimangrovimonas sediminis]|uniref:gamma-glutamylcyclotransferase n=1 Tax=Acidimangrovimonas sediminis TaxID=2056283 RepID=UPI0011AFCB96|nr:gamma-glutamylcyclotransferase [Acidimangrovimonas sediminis]
MADYFFYGTLCHGPLLAAVAGRPIATEPATLADHAVYWAEGQSFPVIVPEAGGRAQGRLALGLTEAEAARLDYYEGGFAYAHREVTLATGAGAEEGRTRARVYLPEPGRWAPGAPWSLDDWAAQWGALVTGAASEFLAGMGHLPAERMMARYGKLMSRAADRQRAEAAPRPAALRRLPVPEDVQISAVDRPWAGFFAVEAWRLRHRRFDGGLTPEIEREVFISPDAVTVLPYDPVRDRVMLVEQFRAGPIARGDPAAWQIEAIAGLIDPGETPEQAARREAAEEAGIALQELLHAAGYYSATGARTEFVHSYIAIADLPEDAAGLGGLASEVEDIRSHVVSFAMLMDLVASGEAGNAPLLVSALWLARERDRLRAV